MAHTNRLANESSPYLRQHATNPVDWYPWGDAAFERARREDRPIVLSVGYSACHWCHVMAHESFEDETCASLMNDHFICIKVDREERPDVDQLYQGVVQVMGRGGGWPLTVFLAPDLRPFFGGTYFPPHDGYGLPGFTGLLVRIAASWRDDRSAVATQCDSFHEALSEFCLADLGARDLPVDEGLILSAASAMVRHIDPANGGFGSQPKFPNPMNLALMLRAFRRSGDPLFLERVTLTLEKMARGGIFDQLGGGFHRYTVDAAWRTPHFEKMLSDNAQLIHLYAEAFQVRPTALWRTVVEETAGYVQREMTNTEGTFFSAQDADSEGEEGRFFIWRRSDLVRVLGDDDARLVAARYGVTERGNFEHGASVLEVVRSALDLAEEWNVSPHEIEQRLDSAKRAMRAYRSERVRPETDDKVLTGWNGLMIRALALSSRVFHRADWAAMATRCADALLAKRLDSDGRLLRCESARGTRFNGLLEDYGHLSSGLVALYQATFEPKFLEAARALADTAFDVFWDERQSAYRTTPPSEPALIIPTWATTDNASPSGASTLTEAQLALSAITGDRRHLERARRFLSRQVEAIENAPMSFGHLLLAADTLLDGGACVSIDGALGEARELLDVVNEAYAPTIALKFTATARGRPSATVCRHFTCEPPTEFAEELRARLCT
jgi:uncharacterized protein YyaL (SSP411 family)